MSTTTTPEPTTPGPTPPIDAAAPRAAETAPSMLVAEGPTVARAIGFGGLFLLVLGIVAIVTNEALGPRWIGKGGGYLAAAFGLTLMLYHAVRDGEQEVRRLYGMFALVWLVLAFGAALVPGPVFEAAAKKEVGYNLLPGIGFGFIALLFTIPFVRHETDRKYHDAAVLGLLTVGALLSVGSLVAGVIRPDFLVGPGIGLALLGLGFLAAYMGQTDTSEGIGYKVAFAIGAAGAAVAVYAIARSAVPTILYEGPTALRKPNGALDTWRAAGRGLLIVLALGVALLGWQTRRPQWLRIVVTALGLAAAAVLVAGSLTSVTGFIAQLAQTPFLVPGGIILTGLGLVYLAVSLGICSDNQFVTLTRRELSAYFLSPIGYLVLGGLVLIQWVGYWVFINQLTRAGQARQPMTEPIVSDYFFALFPVIALLLEVPALTMRLLAEEKRTGSLEVLMTAPVSETPVILSKFLATWLFFVFSWLPSGLFLIALRVEGGQPFDYRPLLSFYVAFAAQGLAFVGMGLFFSTLTRNQIVAAVLTFVGMILFLLCYFLRSDRFSLGIPAFLQTTLGRLSFVSMWNEALEGRLPLRDTLLYASLSVFFLFLSVKVLEARKWS